jgi:hypothetical protein
MLRPKVLPFRARSAPRPKGTERAQMVLQIGRDSELLRLRASIISSAGYTVHSMTPDQVPVEFQKTQGPRVWIFCHTLDFYELALLAAAIRNRHPADKLMRLSSLKDIEQAPGLFDELLEPIMGVDELLRLVATLAHCPSVRNSI